MTPSTSYNLDWIFTYHPPRPDQLPRYERLRTAARAFAQVMLEETLPCADQAAALRLIREAVMTANAAIAMDGSLIGPAKPGE